MRTCNSFKAGSRLILAAVCVCVLVSAAKVQASQDAVDGLEKFRRKDPIGLDRSERRTVYEVFSFFCPHCEKLDPVFTQWGKTLPEGMKFEQVPLVGRDIVLLQMARAYYAARSMGPDAAGKMKKALFQEAKKVSGQRNKYAKDETYHDIARRIGLNHQNFLYEWEAFARRVELTESAKIQYDYKLNHVPSLIIGGEYVISPGDVPGGDMGTFLKLANGLTSAVLKERRWP